MIILIYTNSKSIDIFKIQQDHLKELNIYNVFILSDINSPIYKYPVIIYNNNLSYPEQIIHSIHNLKSYSIDYFIFCHDYDIIVSYSSDILFNIKIKMVQHNIDSVILNNVSLNYDKINIIDDLSIVKNVSNNLFILSPTIWKSSTFIDILNNNITYNINYFISKVNDYILDKNYNIYNIHSNNLITYFDFNCSKYFLFFRLIHNDHIVFDYSSELLINIINIYKKYKINRLIYNFEYKKQYNYNKNYIPYVTSNIYLKNSINKYSNLSTNNIQSTNKINNTFQYINIHKVINFNKFLYK